MNLKTIGLAGIAFLLMLFTSVNAQQITANDSTGCAPFSGVQFTGIPGAVNPIWDFGDGSSAGILNPTHTFTSVGTYTVTFKSNNNPTQTIIIKVFGKPTPKFTIVGPQMGCTGFPFKFQDQSTGGGGVSVVKWNWAFGDGTGDNTGNSMPNHSYSVGGQFTVSLIVTDANGCDSTTSIPNYVTASQKPTINLTTTPLAACDPNLSVTFNGVSSVGNSPLGPEIVYSWSFGNGSTSTLASPAVVTYTTQGTFPVKFKITNKNNCSDSTFRTVVIGKPKAYMVAPDTVCKGIQITFQDTSKGGASSIWNYGDGTGNTLNNKHTYATAGTYTVSLVVKSGSGNCSDTAKKRIVVEEAKANFTSSPTYFCSVPVNVSFTDLSTNAASWSWTFFNTGVSQILPKPDTSRLQNPVIKLVNQDTNQYTINQQEIIIATLNIVSRHGCVSSKTIFLDTIYLPTARFMPDTAEGCAPLTVHFSDSSISKETIVEWKYDFGDGTSITGTNANPTHTYTKPGIYYPTLIIKNAKGCIDTSYAIEIRVGAPPHPDFSVSKTTVCPKETIDFTDLTPATDSVDVWHYSADGDIFLSACPGDRNPSWPFSHKTGPQDVTLTVGSRGCYASVTKTGIITVKGPIVNLDIRSDCDSSMVYTLKGELQDVTDWKLEFGDGKDTSISSNVANQYSIIHTYPATINYQAKITATNSTSGCPPWIDTTTVRVRNIKAAFQSDTAFCIKDSVIFNAAASIDVNPEFNYGYYWFFNDGSGPGITDSPTIKHAFTAPGIKDVMLVVKDVNSCRDTVRKRVRVSSITPKITASPIYGCIPYDVTFKDKSTSDTTITSRSWAFGDGGNTTTAIDSAIHTFSDNTPKQFKVKMTVTNILGCKASDSVLVIPSKPVASFNATNITNICSGNSVSFSPVKNNHSQYTWDFGDGTPVVTQQSSSHVFSNSGAYSVKLSVIDSIGCKKDSLRIAYVSVQDTPSVGFKIVSNNTNNDFCYPASVNYIDTSKANVFLKRVWDLGNGSPIVPNQTVTTQYGLPGTYYVSLEVTTTFGCKSKVKKPVRILGPLANFSFAPSSICKGEKVDFQIKDTSNLFTYYWDFGDGFDTTAISPVQHQFNHHPPNGQAQVSLIFWSEDSTCKKSVTQPVKIHEVIAEFSRNNEVVSPRSVAGTDTSHCLTVTDIITNQSQNANSYAWDFGDGFKTSQKDPPVHKYAAPGIYTIQLYIKDSNTGCVDTIRKKMVVHPDPLSAPVGGRACLGSSVQLKDTLSSVNNQYQWAPPNDLSSAIIPNPVASPSVTTNYTLTVTTPDGCTKTSVVNAFIQQPPVKKDWDTTIIIGETVTMSPPSANGGGFTYLWEPPDTLSCTACANPSIKPLQNKVFKLTISDSMKCFEVDMRYRIFVEPLSSLDVPSAFTPNGDGVNDIIYVDGWGIKKLLEFKIYNRWGELIFESNDLNVGWDGTYKGVPQNLETYVYTVSAETYVDKQPITKKGYIKLLR